MARKARVWWPGATYHVMCRGNHQHEIYRDDEDREVYLSVLRQVQITQPYILHTYCLMTQWNLTRIYLISLHSQYDRILVKGSQLKKRPKPYRPPFSIYPLLLRLCQTPS